MVANHSRVGAHPGWASVFDEAQQQVLGQLTDLAAERAQLADQKSAKQQELATLQAQLPFLRQQYRSGQISQAAVHQAEADEQQARRALNSCKQAIKRCDGTIALRQKKLAQQLLDGMGPELPTLEAQRSAWLDLVAKAVATLRQVPADLGALQLEQDRLDHEYGEQVDRAGSIAQAQEHRRIVAGR